MKENQKRHQRERNLAICELAKETAGGWDVGCGVVPFEDEDRINKKMSEIFKERGIDLKKMNKFMDKFFFRENMSLLVGVERECFITDLDGNIIPDSVKILSVLADQSKFGYELSACQLEDRIGPVVIDGLRASIEANEIILLWAEKFIKFKRLFKEVATKDMPLDIFPDQSGRYQKISSNMPRNILLAACRVIGTHIHIGMPNHEVALKVYNSVIHNLDYLCKKGDGSSGKRLEIYKEVAPDQSIRPYANWEDYYQEAVKKGFVENPRDCWHLIRISTHGTIEFRMFGATNDIGKIEKWAKICHKLCKKAMES